MDMLRVEVMQRAAVMASPEICMVAVVGERADGRMFVGFGVGAFFREMREGALNEEVDVDWEARRYGMLMNWAGNYMDAYCGRVFLLILR